MFTRLARMCVVLGLVGVLLLKPAQPAYAASIIVNSLADNATGGNGLCTLREAINNANRVAGGDGTSGDCAAGSAATTMDTITFSVSGTILTSSALPAISGTGTQDTGYVTIDGGGNITLQRLAGTGAGLEIGHGADTTSNFVIKNLTIAAYTGQGIDLIRVSNATIDNVIITGIGNQGIRIQSGNTTGVTIQNSRIGVDSAGNASGNGGNGIQINDGADSVTIRNNTISANTGDGIQLAGAGGNASGHLIENNRIGVNVAGTSCGSPNTYGNGLIGIDIQGGVLNSTIQNNIIGCNGRTQTGGGNQGDGIEMSSGSTTGTQILNNYIGTNATGASLGNHQNGIDINGGTNSTIQGNTIANNGSSLSASNVNNDGIHIDGTTTDNHKITQNSIYNNGGSDPDGLGIDLNGDGVTANDAGDPDSGSNAKNNFPVIASAVGNGGTGQYDVTFSWDLRTGEGPWTIEFFCNKDGGGQGRSYQASTIIAAGTPSGSTTFSFTPVPGTCNDATNNRMTATATNNAGSTSEFSANVDPTAVVLRRVDARTTTPTALLLAEVVLLGLLCLIASGYVVHRAKSRRV